MFSAWQSAISVGGAQFRFAFSCFSLRAAVRRCLHGCQPIDRRLGYP